LAGNTIGFARVILGLVEEIKSFKSEASETYAKTEEFEELLELNKKRQGHFCPCLFWQYIRCFKSWATSYLS
jgi:hypothetical protein